MIFMHTIEHVLAGTKVQTSRLWKPDYVFAWSEYEEENQVVLSQKAWDKHQIRKLYYVGQELSVQPNRGMKGIARIRILELAKRDVRKFDDLDVEREGFKYWGDFAAVWASMHDKEMAGLEPTWGDYMQRPVEFYTALVIRFELVTEQKAAA